MRLSTGLMVALAAIAVAAGDADDKARFRDYKATVLQSPDLIRFYTFEEGQGEEVANHVLLEPGRMASSGGPLGSLTLDRPSVDDQAWPDRETADGQTAPRLVSPEWTRGRWPWKAAVDCGRDITPMPWDATKLYRSGITGVEFANGGTLAGWFRIHESAPGTGGCNILRLGGGWSDGFTLGWGRAASGTLEFRVGGTDPASRARVSVGNCAAGVWHHFAVTLDGATVRLYLDGQLGGEAPFTGEVVPTTYKDQAQVGPFFENSSPTRWGSFLMVGHNPAPKDGLNGRFDMGELAIYIRALTAEEIATQEQGGRPTMTREEQLADYRAVAARREVQDRIRMAIDFRTGGYVRIDQPVVATVEIPADTGLTGEFMAVFDIQTLMGKPVERRERPLAVDKALREEIRLPECGVYYLDMAVVKADGTEVKHLSRMYSIGVVPPAPTSLTATNPVAFWADNNDLFHYDAPLRRMNYVSREHFLPRYETYAARIPDFRAFVWFHGKMATTPEARAKNEELFTEAAEILEGRSICGFEMTSEPHTKDPAGYVDMLRIALAKLRPLFPDAPVVPPGAAPPSIPMIAAILREGGIDYVDGVSYHPYTANPIAYYLWDDAPKQLQQVVDTYPEKKLVMWDTESAVFSLPRLRYRPMTRDDANRARFPSGDRNGHVFYHWFVSMRPEDEAAAMQCHDILLKLALGYRLYTVHTTPNVSNAGLSNGVMASLRGVAITALAGQVLNDYNAVTRMPLAAVDNMCILIRQADGTSTAAIFSMEPAAINFRVRPETTYRTMDMLGNFGTIAANRDGLITVESRKAPVYLFAVPEDMQEVVPLKLIAPPVLPEAGTMTGELTVTNPFATPLRGVLAATPIRGASVTLARTAVDLAPGATMSVPVTLKATFLKRRPYLLGVELKGPDGQLVAASQTIFESPGVLQMVPLAPRPIVLDGDAADWAGIPETVCDDADSVVHGQPNFAEIWLPQWTNADDLSLSVRTAWRQGDAVYFLVTVRDDVPLPAPEDRVGRAFQYDCLEFFFDSRERARLGSVITPGADQAIVVPRVTPEAGPCTLWYPKKDDHHVDVTCVGRRTADGYVIEGRVTPNDKTDFRVQGGSQFMMDFLIDDTDSLDPTKLRKAAMAMHGKMSNFINSDIWGRYELSLGDE